MFGESRSKKNETWLQKLKHELSLNLQKLYLIFSLKKQNCIHFNIS